MRLTLCNASTQKKWIFVEINRNQTKFLGSVRARSGLALPIGGRRVSTIQLINFPVLMPDSFCMFVCFVGVILCHELRARSIFLENARTCRVTRNKCFQFVVIDESTRCFYFLGWQHRSEARTFNVDEACLFYVVCFTWTTSGFRLGCNVQPFNVLHMKHVMVEHKKKLLYESQTVLDLHAHTELPTSTSAARVTTCKCFQIYS